MKLLKPWKTDQVPPIWHMVRSTSDLLCSSIPFLEGIPWFMWLSYNDMIRWRVPCEQILMPTFPCKCCHHWHSERLIWKNFLVENYPRHHPSIFLFFYFTLENTYICGVRYPLLKTLHVRPYHQCLEVLQHKCTMALQCWKFWSSVKVSQC